MFLYSFLIRCYGFVIWLAALRNHKAKQWVEGRKNWRLQLKNKISSLGSGPRVWVHCASYGEFEQGRPLMEAIKKEKPDTKIILTFFSPSGYEVFKNWTGADVVCYLPLDTGRNATDFLDIVKPTTILFIKYEFWVHFLFRIKNLEIPAFLVSAVFKPHHPFFRWYGGFFRRSLLAFQKLFVQDENSAALLKSIGITNVEVCGDTRFDRVVEIKDHFSSLPFIENFCKGKRVIIAGSSWPDDEELLVAAFKKLAGEDLRMIIAPHNVDEKHITNLEQLLTRQAVSYQLYTDQKPGFSSDVLILDTIGLLSKIYFYADVVYIGGGFNSGIHNCLEPAVYLKPVLFYGKGYEKYNEAVDLINIGAARNVLTRDELENGLLHYLNNAADLQNVKEDLKIYFEKNSGVTKKILASLFTK